MRRREFIALVGCAVARPLAARAQQSARIPRVAYVSFAARLSELVGDNPINPAARAFKHGLRDLGYVEGQHLLLEWRTAEGNLERLPQLIRELVSNNVGVIVSGSQAVTLAAHAVTRTVPIIMTTDANPLELNLVPSLARPTDNITGLTYQVSADIYGKQMSLLRALLPKLERLAWLMSPEVTPHSRAAVETACRQMGLTLVPVESPARDYMSAFALLMRDRPDAVLVGGGSGHYNARHLIVEFADQSPLPTVYFSREFVDASGLISYGPNIPDLFRRAAGYVDRILKGATPAELPIELPTKFELLINLKAAKALGLVVPPTLLASANEAARVHHPCGS
jgi:putative ABC transport system substrate-binding protein